MNIQPTPATAPNLPEIVRIVLNQAAKLRAAGAITQEKFESQIGRLMKEELSPRGYSLERDELADGHTRFLIQSRSGTVREMIDCK